VSAGEDQALSFIYLVGALVLVASAFAVRRIPIGQSLKMALAWVLIFLAAFVVFTLKDDFASLGRRIASEVSGEPQVMVAGEALRIRKSPDGHFWVSAKLNGEDVDFLVDSGATVTSLSAGTAERAGVTPGNGLPVVVDTANGAVTARRARDGSIRADGRPRHELSLVAVRLGGRGRVADPQTMSAFYIMYIIALFGVA
jgi:aspartyl protease family protein